MLGLVKEASLVFVKMAAAEAVRRRAVAWEALGHGCELGTAKERRGEGGNNGGGRV